MIGPPGFEAAQQSVDHRAGVAEVAESTERRCRWPRAELIRTGRAAEWPAGCANGAEGRAVRMPARHPSFVEVRP